MKRKLKALVLITALVVMLVTSNALSALAGTVAYTYDDLNRLTKVQYQNGSAIFYEYDAAGNITSIQQQGSVTYGDVNGADGINITDAVLVLKYITNPTLSIDLTAADVNGVDSINITDAVLILKHITNPDVPFPAESL